jgi:hypothetical protein
MRSHRIRAFAVLALLGGALPVAACVSPNDLMDRKGRLEETQLSYTQHVRWGELEKASAYVDPELRDDYRSHAAAFETIRITDYEIGNIEYDDGLASATVEVTYRGYALTALIERPIRETQRWYRDGGSSWLVRTEIGGVVDGVRGVSR